MHPVPGKLKSRITYLEMTRPPASPPPPPAVKLAPLRAERPSLAFYRFLYETVGEPWLWWERRRLADEDLAAIVHDPMVEVYVLYMGGVPAGFSELDRRQEPDIELAYFGLVTEFIGSGLGRFFLRERSGTVLEDQIGPKRIRTFSGLQTRLKSARQVLK